MTILVENVTIHAGDFRLERASLNVPAGAYAMLMGQTGCGKTSLLEAIAGLKPIVSGTIRLGNTDVTQFKPAARQIGYVPQDGALFTTMNVRQHLAFALAIRSVHAAELQSRVEELAELLKIERLLERQIQGLSGGERQRVAIGRALSFRPQTLLLDEPLSALDEETRQQMYELLARVTEHEHVTTLHVTHNREEAERLGDCVFVVRDGKVSRTSL